MIFNINNSHFEISELFINYSPYLKNIVSQIKENRIGVYIDENGRIMLDLDPFQFTNYYRFLIGMDFEMDDETVELFDFMGHHNYLEYPIDIWKMKLRDNWIRDFMYPLKLYNNPLYGLREIPVINKMNFMVNKTKDELMEEKKKLGLKPNARLDSKLYHKDVDVNLCKNIYIAGGAAMYAAGIISKLKDIDVFFTDKNMLNEFIKNIYTSDGWVHIKNHVIDCETRFKYYSQKFKHDISTYEKTQLILRNYLAPTEIVHGFDIDCVGILYDVSTNKCYATERAYYAIQNKINIFDPARASPSYAHRLAKYKTRGFNIYMPFINKTNLNMDYYDKLYEQVECKLFDEMGNIFYREQLYETNIVLTDKHIDFANKYRKYIESKYGSMSTTKYLQALNFYGDYLSKRENRVMGTYLCMLLSRRGDKAKEKKLDEFKLIPKDPASICILSQYYNFNTFLWKMSDYDANKRKNIEKIFEDEEFLIVKDDNGKHLCTSFWLKNGQDMEYIMKHKHFPGINWKEQNPSEQVSSTFYPTPIKSSMGYEYCTKYDMIEWYKQSPLYKVTV